MSVKSPNFQRTKVDPARMIAATVAQKRVNAVKKSLARAEMVLEQKVGKLNQAERHEWDKRTGVFRDNRKDNSFKGVKV